MPRKRKQVTKVTVFQPYSIDLTKLTSNNTLDVQVRTGDDLMGTLKMGRGSVQWWPRGSKTHALKKSWREFADLLNANIAQ